MANTGHIEALGFAEHCLQEMTHLGANSLGGSNDLEPLNLTARKVDLANLGIAANMQPRRSADCCAPERCKDCREKTPKSVVHPPYRPLRSTSAHCVIDFRAINLRIPCHQSAQT